MSKSELDKDGWPVDGSTLYFEKLTEPVIKALRQAYSMQRRNRTKDIKYSGPDHKFQANCPPIRERLKAESLEYEREDQGRSALEVIIGHAVQLGIEQGKRYAKEDSEWKTMEIMARVGQVLMENEKAKREGTDHGQNTANATPQT